MMKRLSLMAVMLVSMLLLTLSVSADGTETLGTPGIAIADGTDVITAGTGMISQPGTIDITIPAGASVEQVLLYWEGQSIDTADDTISIDGNSVTGTLIGGPTTFFQVGNPPENVQSSTYRADITGLGLVGAGANSLSVTNMDFDFANDGAGLLVIVDDGSSKSVQLKDGNDLAFFAFAPPLDTTAAQTFNFPAAPVDRSATLDMFFSSVSGSVSTGAFRPSSIEVQSGAVVTAHSNLLDSHDGEEWDTIEIAVTVPAGATSVTVQAFSRDDLASGDRPASFTWNAAALSLEVPDEREAEIDIEKFTRVDDVPAGGESCDTLGKPVVLTMVYTGDGPDGSSHSQDSGKVEVTGDPNDAAIVRIIATDKSDPDNSKAKIWFDGVVALGASFEIDAANEGEDRLKSNTFVIVLDQGDDVLQTIKFHTSCSQPLNLGDQFGSALLTVFEGQDGTGSLPAPAPSDFGEDADTPTGPIAEVGDTITWTYVVTNPGDTQLADIVVTDDNGTPGDPGDDFAPDPILDGAHNVGDLDMDGRLDPGEEWLYTATGTAVAGQYANLSDVVGTPVDEGGQQVGDDVTDEDPSHYFAEVPQGDQCDVVGKPVILTMVYTGDGPDGSSHSQDDGKVEVTGDPNDAAIVRIIATDKSDPNNSKAKIWFDGVVALGETYAIDAGNEGEDRLKSNTFVIVLDQDDNVLQTIKFHTSCSQPLAIGDQFGSAEVVGFIGENS